MSRRRSALTALFAAVAATMAIGATANATPLNWQTCDYAPGFQCADMPAPLDYDQPDGPQISVAVIRHLATDQAHRVGSLFWNAGGPGGAPTATLPDFLPYFSAQIQAHFDIVAVDPRGIGRTAQLQCFSTPEEENALLSQAPPAGFPVGAEETQRQISVYSQFDRACAEHGGPIQYHMSTANVARDMDRARAALGEDKLNYWGPSYGTYLGATYANLFPSHVGNIVLDGNVPPVEWNDAQAGATTNTFTRIQSPLGAEAGLQLMLAQCGQVDTSRCAFSAGSSSATASKYQTLLTRLKSAPVTVDGQEFTYSLVVATVGSALEFQNASSVVPAGWKELAATLQAIWTASAPGPVAVASRNKTHMPRAMRWLVHRAGKLGLTAFAPELPEGVYGVLCGESPNPSDPQSYAAQAAWANATQSPSGFGSMWTWLAEPCAEWQARDADRYAGPWNRSPRPLLLVGTLADSNTAYTGTLKMAAETGNARVLTETGGGHTSWLNPSDCANNYIYTFLASGTLPPVGTVCNQNKAPF